MSDEEKRNTVEHQFDSLCRKAIREEKIDYQRELKRYVDKLQKLQAAQTDSFFDDSFDLFDNEIEYAGVKIKIKRDYLYDAIQELDEKKKEIILLYYFLNLNDAETAKRLHMIKRTVNNKRNDALKDLRNTLEKKDDSKRE